MILVHEAKVKVLGFFLRVKFYLPLNSVGVEAVAIKKVDPIAVCVLISIDHVHVFEHIGMRN